MPLGSAAKDKLNGGPSCRRQRLIAPAVQDEIATLFIGFELCKKLGGRLAFATRAPFDAVRVLVILGGLNLNQAQKKRRG
jgi:hypothetical protein